MGPCLMDAHLAEDISRPERPSVLDLEQIMPAKPCHDKIAPRTTLHTRRTSLSSMGKSRVASRFRDRGVLIVTSITHARSATLGTRGKLARLLCSACYRSPVTGSLLCTGSGSTRSAVS